MPLGPGERFAGYTVVRLLGVGGMGEVYLAEHPRLPRQDALKILGTDVSAGEEYRQRFIREADLAAQDSHPELAALDPVLARAFAKDPPIDSHGARISPALSTRQRTRACRPPPQHRPCKHP